MPFLRRVQKPSWLVYLAGSLSSILLMMVIMSVVRPKGLGLSGAYIRDNALELIISGMLVAVALNAAIDLYDRFQGRGS